MVGYKVAELEEILNVSKQAIYNRLNSSKFSGYVYREKNIRYLKEEGLNLLKLEYGLLEKVEKVESKEIFEEVEIKENKGYVERLEQENQYFKERVEYLELENKSLLGLLQQQNNIIESQTEVVKREQQITLNHTELLLLEKKEILKLRAEQYREKHEVNKKWYKKLFK